MVSWSVIGLIGVIGVIALALIVGKYLRWLSRCVPELDDMHLYAELPFNLPEMPLDKLDIALALDCLSQRSDPTHGYPRETMMLAAKEIRRLRQALDTETLQVHQITKSRERLFERLRTAEKQLELLIPVDDRTGDERHP